MNNTGNMADKYAGFALVKEMLERFPGEREGSLARRLREAPREQG